MNQQLAAILCICEDSLLNPREAWRQAIAWAVNVQVWVRVNFDVEISPNTREDLEIEGQ